MPSWNVPALAFTSAGTRLGGSLDAPVGAFSKFFGRFAGEILLWCKQDINSTVGQLCLPLSL